MAFLGVFVLAWRSRSLYLGSTILYLVARAGQNGFILINPLYGVGDDSACNSSFLFYLAPSNFIANKNH